MQKGKYEEEFFTSLKIWIGTEKLTQIYEKELVY
jgi:hypothetical protein